MLSSISKPEAKPYTLHLGDCLEVLPSLPDSSVDAVVTDPPYGLSFMGKNWDHGVPGEQFWREVLRVAKPGAHLLAFGGTRTYHRLACAIEDAGWEIRDCLGWVYSTGFPKSLDVSKAIDKRGGVVPWQADFARHLRDVKPKDLSANAINAHVANGTKSNFWGHFIDTTSQPLLPTVDQYRALRELLPIDSAWDAMFLPAAEREVVGVSPHYCAGRSVDNFGVAGDGTTGQRNRDITAPATDAARQWAGWGTSLKPSFEPVIWATKPLHNVGDCAIIIQNLTQMEAELCKRIASVAAKSSQPIQHGLSEARGDSVQTPAPIQAGVAVGNETGTGAAGVTSWAAAISGSTPEAAHIALNTISLWRRTLEDALSLANTCTTETASSLITDLKTWSLSLSQITLDNIIQAAFHPSGLIAPVSNAAQYFSVVSAKSNAIRELIAQGLVTGSSEIRPAWEPIIVARKPLEGTVAENVLKWHTGAINVDACRVGTESTLRTNGKTAIWADGGMNSEQGGSTQGRWPANLIHDGSEEVVGLFP